MREPPGDRHPERRRDHNEDVRERWKKSRSHAIVQPHPRDTLSCHGGRAVTGGMAPDSSPVDVWEEAGVTSNETPPCPPHHKCITNIQPRKPRSSNFSHFENFNYTSPISRLRDFFGR